MLRSTDFIVSRQLMLRQFTGGIVQRLVGRDEFCRLLLSRRRLERCNDDSSHCRGLFDPHTGELFDIRDAELYSQA